MIHAEDLQAVPLFEGLGPEALDWLADHFEEMRLAPGDVLIEEGSPAEWMFATLAGCIRGVLREEGREVGVLTFEAGEVGGMLPHSRMTRFTAHATAAEASRVARLHIRHFPEMLRRIPELDARLAHLMSDRIRAAARTRLQQDKLVSLGTMAAGLAHELNNPASAAGRAARTLGKTLQALDERASVLLRKVMFRDGEAEADPFRPIYDVIQGESPQLSPIVQSEREDELADWLEENGVEEPWNAAAVLVSSGFSKALLASFTERLAAEHVADFLNWLPRDVEIRFLANELIESTTRISELVSAMKSYSYMDQANEKQLVDLRKGIDDTLTILGHKLKHRQVEVVRDYSETPPVPAYGGELNQVWTNLLDNAIAAVPPEGGRILIQTRHDAPTQTVQIDVVDNGTGIPPEIQGRIFEPFFTTKQAGEGSGLGLDIVYRIVTARHGGSIYVASAPGETRFHVRLPVSPDELRE